MKTECPTDISCDGDQGLMKGIEICASEEEIQTSEKQRDVWAAGNTQYDPPAEHNCAGRQEENSGRKQGLLLHTAPWTTLLRVSPCQKNRTGDRRERSRTSHEKNSLE